LLTTYRPEELDEVQFQDNVAYLMIGLSYINESLSVFTLPICLKIGLSCLVELCNWSHDCWYFAVAFVYYSNR